MKSQILLPFLSILLFTFFSCSQDSDNSHSPDISEEVIEIDTYSSYTSSSLSSRLITFPSDGSYDSLINESLTMMGLFNTDIEIRQTNKFGAFSVINRNCRRRFFVYNKKFFDSLYLLSGSNNAILSVCYHELGHHLYRHPLKSKTESHLHELQSDIYSGFRMAKIGATLEEALFAMKHFGNKDATNTHPGLEERLSAIESGYCSGVSNSVFDCSTQDSLYNANYDDYEINIKEKIDHESFEFIDSPEALEMVEEELGRYEEIFDLIGTLIGVTENSQLIGIENDEPIGEMVEVSDQMRLLRLEHSSYVIEDRLVYAIDHLGIKLKIGTKLK